MNRPRIIVLLCVAFLPTLCGLAWLAGSALSMPRHHIIGTVPADLSGSVVRIQSDSGADLSGWLLPGKAQSGAIILLHGVRENRTKMLERARWLSREGFTILLFDFQAHGESMGKQITFGWLESRDVQAVVKFMREQFPTERLGIIGVSLGGASTLLASPPIEADALVLESVYPTITQAVNDRLTHHLGKWAGILTPVLTSQFKMRIGITPEALRPIDHISKLTMPKFILAGTEDHHTTIAETRDLFQAAALPKQLWEVEGAAHIDLHNFARSEYEKRVGGFLKKHLRKYPHHHQLPE
jgi:alpha-beta hydrolase superfamily lysophospholipase